MDGGSNARGIGITGQRASHKLEAIKVEVYSDS